MDGCFRKLSSLYVLSTIMAVPIIYFPCWFIGKYDKWYERTTDYCPAQFTYFTPNSRSVSFLMLTLPNQQFSLNPVHQNHNLLNEEWCQIDMNFYFCLFTKFRWHFTYHWRATLRFANVSLRKTEMSNK